MTWTGWADLLRVNGIAVNWNDARQRVLKSYREWLRAVRYMYLSPGHDLHGQLHAKTGIHFLNAASFECRGLPVRDYRMLTRSRMISLVSRDPEHVLPQLTCLRYPHKDPPGIRAPSICEPVTRGGCATVSEPC